MPIRIDGFLIDAALREEYELDSDVSSFSTETGSQVIDDVRPTPIRVTIEGVVSDSPLPGKIATERGDQGDGQPLTHKPSEDALAWLKGIHEARQPITIEGVLKTYNDMVLVSLEVPCDATTGHALTFTAEFQQIQYFTNNRATIKVAPPKQTSLGARKDLGNKVTFSLEQGAVIWHHSEPKPLWSTSEVLGYKREDVIKRGTSGYYHVNGQPLTQEELDDFTADQKLWYQTHDANGNPVSFDSLAPTDSQLNKIDPEHLSDLPKDATFSGTHQQWEDANGNPITYNPIFGKWM